MRSKAPLLTVALVASLATVAGGTVYAATLFSDVPDGHWARTAIEWAFQNHIMTGPGGQERAFYPDRATTRAELAATSMRLYERTQVDIDALSQRIVELETRLGLRQSPMVILPPPARALPSPRSSVSPTPVQPDVPMQPVSFVARLFGSLEVPPVRTSGRGTATFRVTNEGLWYDINVVNLSTPITGAHFHLGGRGQNGAILESISFDGERARGFWRSISSTEWKAITDGQVYVNVHTNKYPDGEIRGQIEFLR